MTLRRYSPLEQTGSDILAEILLAASGVESVGDTPDGVELCMRSGPDGDYIFVLNHTNHTVPYTPPADWIVYGGIILNN